MYSINSGKIFTKKLNPNGISVQKALWLLVALSVAGIVSLFFGMWMYWIDL